MTEEAQRQDTDELHDTLIKKSEKMCYKIISALDKLAIEVAQTHKDDLEIFTKDIHYENEEKVTDERINEIIRLFVVLGLICELGVQHRDNYFKVLNEILTTTVDASEEKTDS
jgi:hypothetical protein